MFATFLLLVFLAVLVVVALGFLAFGKGVWKAAAAIPLLLFAITLAWSTWVYVPQGSVGVVSTFGIIHTDHTIAEGTLKPFGIAPWQSVEVDDVRTDNLDFHAGNHFEGRTKDNAVVEIELTQPIRVNPTAAPWLRTRFKAGWKDFILPYVGASLKNAVADTGWQSLAQSNRAGFASLFMGYLQKDLAKVLEENGIPANVAASAFILSDPQIGSVRLPRELVDALHKLQATQIAQQTADEQIKLADKQVVLRSKEGKGYHGLFDGLPANVTPESASQLITAQAFSVFVHEYFENVKSGKQMPPISFVMGTTAVPPSVPTGMARK